MYSDTQHTHGSRPTVPRRLLIVPAVIFVMVTSEFMISPLLPSIAESLGRPLGQTSLLITALAAGQVLGGITLGVVLTRIRPAVALAGLAFAFAAAQATPLITASWPAVLGTRALAGFLMAAMFTVALTAAGALVPAALVARASGIVFSGVTFGLTIGSPLAGWIGGTAGWQWAFAAVSIGGVITGLLTLAIFRAPIPPVASGDTSETGHPLRNPRLWATYLSALLLVGAAAAAYSFFGALLTERTSWSPTVISLVLLGYGAVSIVGNLVVARNSGHRPDRVLAVVGLISVGLFLITAVSSNHSAILVIAIVALGAVGFTVNPALISLVVVHSGNRAITNALSATSVTLGIVIGSALAGVLVDHGYGITSPLLLAAAAAALAVIAIQFAKPKDTVRQTGSTSRGSGQDREPTPAGCGR